MTKFQLKIY